jgi:hypothetical protein
MRRPGRPGFTDRNLSRDTRASRKQVLERDAARSGGVCDVVLGVFAYEHDVAGQESQRVVRIAYPQVNLAIDDR